MNILGSQNDKQEQVKSETLLKANIKKKLKLSFFGDIMGR